MASKLIFLYSLPFLPIIRNHWYNTKLNRYYAAQLPFFKSIFNLLPPFLLVRLARPGRSGLLLARGLWLWVLGVGEELTALPAGVGETLSKEPCPDWSSTGSGFTTAGSGVLARASGRLTSSLVFGLISCLGSGWESVLVRTTIGLAFEEETLSSAEKSCPIRLFS